MSHERSEKMAEKNLSCEEVFKENMLISFSEEGTNRDC